MFSFKYSVCDGESVEYKNMTQKQKLDYLWSSIIDTKNDKFKAPTIPKIEFFWFSLITDWSFAFNYPCDIVQRSCKYRPFHPDGYCVLIQFIPNKKYQKPNLFKETVNGLQRIGYSTCTAGRRDGLLGCGFKFFPTKTTESVNLLFQAPNNIIHNEEDDIRLIQSTNSIEGTKLFCPGSMNKRLDSMYAHVKSLETAKGLYIGVGNLESLYLKSMIPPTKIRDLPKQDLLNKRLYTVCDGNFNEIGTIYALSNYITSDFGNESLWFHHNRLMNGVCPFMTPNILRLFFRISCWPISMMLVLIEKILFKIGLIKHMYVPSVFQVQSLVVVYVFSMFILCVYFDSMFVHI